MGRKLRTNLPVLTTQLQPRLPNAAKLRKKERKTRDRMIRNFDKRHVMELGIKPLTLGDTVWIPERKVGGTVERESNTRSYVIQTEEGNAPKKLQRSDSYAECRGS